MIIVLLTTNHDGLYRIPLSRGTYCRDKPHYVPMHIMAGNITLRLNILTLLLNAAEVNNMKP